MRGAGAEPHRHCEPLDRRRLVTVAKAELGWIEHDKPRRVRLVDPGRGQNLGRRASAVCRDEETLTKRPTVRQALRELPDDLVALGLGDRVADVVDQHPMGQPRREEVARRLVVPLARDHLDRRQAGVRADQLVDDRVGIGHREGEVGHAARSLDLRRAGTPPATGAQRADDAREEHERRCPLGRPRVRVAPQQRLALKVVTARGPAGLVVVDNLQLSQAAVVRDRPVVLDETRAQRRLANSRVTKREVARSDQSRAPNCRRCHAAAGRRRSPRRSGSSTGRAGTR